MISGIDEAVLLFFQENVRCSVLTPVMKLFSLLFDYGAVCIVLGLLLVFFKKTRRLGIAVLVCLSFSFIVTNLIIKNAVGRTRPGFVIEGLTVIGKELNDFSFPSGHTAAAFSTCYPIVRRCGRKSPYTYIAIASSVITAISRIYLGFHYPSDVICAAAFGLICAAAAYAIFIRLYDRKKSSKAE